MSKKNWTKHKSACVLRNNFTAKKALELINKTPPTESEKYRFIFLQLEYILNDPDTGNAIVDDIFACGLFMKLLEFWMAAVVARTSGDQAWYVIVERLIMQTPLREAYTRMFVEGLSDDQEHPITLGEGGLAEAIAKRLKSISTFWKKKYMVFKEKWSLLSAIERQEKHTMAINAWLVTSTQHGYKVSLDTFDVLVDELSTSTLDAENPEYFLKLVDKLIASTEATDRNYINANANKLVGLSIKCGDRLQNNITFNANSASVIDFFVTIRRSLFVEIVGTVFYFVVGDY